jgi:hypothetical protein
LVRAPESRKKLLATAAIAKLISQLILGNQDQKALGACIRGNLKLEVTSEQLKANKPRVLVVFGSKEGDGNPTVPEGFRRVAKLIGAKVQVIDGSDHVGTIARPELAAAIRTFLGDYSQ